MSRNLDVRVKSAVWLETFKSTTAVQRRIRAEFGRTFPVPHHNSINKWHAKLFEKGSVLYGKRNRKNTVLTEEKAEEIFEYYRTHPKTTVRRAALKIDGISKSLVHRCMKNKKLFPYKAQIVQKLSDPDQDTRLAFARNELQRINHQKLRRKAAKTGPKTWFSY